MDDPIVIVFLVWVFSGILGVVLTPWLERDKPEIDLFVYVLSFILGVVVVMICIADWGRKFEDIKFKNPRYKGRP